MKLIASARALTQWFQRSCSHYEQTTRKTPPPPILLRFQWQSEYFRQMTMALDRTFTVWKVVCTCQLISHWEPVNSLQSLTASLEHHIILIAITVLSCQTIGARFVPRLYLFLKSVFSPFFCWIPFTFSSEKGKICVNKIRKGQQFRHATSIMCINYKWAVHRS